jgi:predicted transcriptional regulator
MKIREIASLLGADVLCGEPQLDEEVQSACGSDMMSDVLAFVKDQGVLVTGLINPQVIRTAMMTDMRCVVFVRGKRPTAEMVDLAKDHRIAVLASAARMYEACGKLYAGGLGSGVCR